MEKKMSLSRQEIIDYASRYVTPEDEIDFTHDNEVFALMGRTITANRILRDDEGWEFNGYGLCLGYVLDDVEKPVGKWLWMHFLSLIVYPPTQQVLKLQPPHVVKGRFQNPDRTYEFKFVKMGVPDEKASLKVVEKPKKEKVDKKHNNSDTSSEKIIPFRKKQ